MGKRGPAKTYKTPAEMKQGILEYFAECKEEDVFADEAGMRIFLGLSEEGMKNLCTTGGFANEYRKLFAWAKDMRESQLSRWAAADNKRANGCFNLLKQKKNGGYSDGKEKGDGKVKLEINVTGCGGSSSFK